MIQLNRILHPTDFSDRAKKAQLYAAALAARFESELHLLHVNPPLTAAMLSPGAIMPPNLEAERQSSAEAALSNIDFHEAVYQERVIRKAVTGPPFLEIVRYAGENEIDLIVLGTHGHSGLAHLLMGSVAENVVRKAPCPVLTVKPDGHQFVMP